VYPIGSFRGCSLQASGCENILLIRLKSMGDVLFVLPALNLVRDNFPDSRITFLTSSENAPLLEGFAAVDSVIAVDRAIYRRKQVREICRTTVELLRRLRREKFTRVVDFQGYGETGWLTWITGARDRWGYVYRAGRFWAYTRAERFLESLHPVDRNLSLLARCGLHLKAVRNTFHLPDSEVLTARAFFREHGLDPGLPTMFIQPFTSSPGKNWPLEKYLALARHWRHLGIQVIFGGGPSERGSLGPAVGEGFPVAAGAPLLTAAGLVGLSTLVVGGDTGLIHLGVAMGKRVVVLIQGEARNNTWPYAHPDWVLESAPGERLADVPLARVLEATGAALQELLVGASAAR
jgi:ADP-heptose:LPS heptosyltransferase